MKRIPVFLFLFLCATRVGAQQVDLADLGAQLSALESLSRHLEAGIGELRSQIEALEGGPEEAEPNPEANAQIESDPNVVGWEEWTAPDRRFNLYGFVRVDAIVDSQRADNTQKPLFIRSGSEAGGSEFTLHPRLTRLGLDFTPFAESVPGAPAVTGKVEVDFQNGGRESRQALRIRHAYLEWSRGSASILAGQTWDIISPLFPTANGDTLMWNAGNLGDRRPQVRFTFNPEVGNGRLEWTGGLALGGAVSPTDLDLDGYRDAESSGRPNFQARLGFRAERASIGVWGHKGWERVNLEERTQFASHVLGADFDLSLTSRIRWRGEAWLGSNLRDIRGGAGQGLNRGRRIPIRSRGGWSELSFQTMDRNALAVGYSLDDPTNRDLETKGILLNRAVYLADRIDLGRGVQLGIDYIYWKTRFQGQADGTNHRTNVFVQYRY